MDPRRFDRIARAVGAGGLSRRGVARAVVAGALGLAATGRGRPAAAACNGEPCNSDAECCAGTNCLLGVCNTCGAAGSTCSAKRPCCRNVGLTCCDGVCVRTASSSQHCGECDQACRKGSSCSNGLCCPTGTVNRNGICCTFAEQNCNGQCKNLQTDRANCGTCGRACATNNICSKGKCCANGRINCSGRCVNLRTDPNNCGQCGRRCVSGRCVNRQCTPPVS